MSFFTVISPGKVGKENTTHSLTAKKSEDVTFRAENEIVLKDGFTAEKGSEFVAVAVDDCDVRNFECNQLPTEPELLVKDEKNQQSTHLFPPNLKSSQKETEFKVNAYPNPFDEEVQFEVSVPKYEDKLHLTIVDIKGRKVIDEEKALQEEIFINTKQWEPGIYFYKLNSGNQSTKGKILKK